MVRSKHAAIRPTARQDGRFQKLLCMYLVNGCQRCPHKSLTRAEKHQTAREIGEEHTAHFVTGTGVFRCFTCESMWV